MVLSQAGFADGKGTLLMILSQVQGSEIAEHNTEVVKTGGGIGVIGPKLGAPDGKRTLVMVPSLF